MIIQTIYLYCTRKSTENIVNTSENTYESTNIKKVAPRDTKLSSYERKLLLGLPNEFKDLFYGTLGKWNTLPVELDINTKSNRFNVSYYLMPRMNNETFSKELMRLVEIDVITPV